MADSSYCTDLYLTDTSLELHVSRWKQDNGVGLRGPVGRLSADKCLLPRNEVKTEAGLFAVLFYVEGAAGDGCAV